MGWDLVLVPWEPLFLVPPSKVPSMEANRARASTPVEGGKGKPTLEEAPPLEELELEDKTSTGRSGSSCPPARGAPATMAGGGGKHLERMSLDKVLWRSLWWHPSLWQLLLQQPAFLQQRFQQQLPEPGRIQQPGFQQPGLQPEPGFQQPEQPSLPMRLQPNVPGPEREHPRRLPAQRQHREDLVLHHWLEQQLWRPADLEEISQQPLVLHGLQQPRTMRNVNSAII